MWTFCKKEKGVDGWRITNKTQVRVVRKSSGIENGPELEKAFQILVLFSKTGKWLKLKWKTGQEIRKFHRF